MYQTSAGKADDYNLKLKLEENCSYKFTKLYFNCKIITIIIKFIDLRVENWERTRE